MPSIPNTDLDVLEAALKVCLHSWKQPKIWSKIVAQARVQIDYPSSRLLQVMIAHEPEHFRLLELANQLGVEAPSVSRKIQELENADLVMRIQSTNDLRAFDLVVSDKGHQISSKLCAAQREILAEIMSSWPNTERKIFIKLFQRFSLDIQKYHRNLSHTITALNEKKD